MKTPTSNYEFSTSNHAHTHGYLWGPIQKVLKKYSKTPSKIFEVGCGNGSTANSLDSIGWEVLGVDPSEDGIKIANEIFPNLKLHLGDAYENLASEYGKFPFVLSLEVVEHVYAPRDYAAQVSNLLEDGGIAIISTPYHGYLKNLAIAITGGWDKHLTALWDGGHIKFWSPKTITVLLNEVGLEVVEIQRLGRIPPLAMSMLIVARKKDS